MASDLEPYSLILTSDLPRSVGKVIHPQLQGSEVGEKASRTLVSALGDSLGRGSLKTVEARYVSM